MKENVHLRMRTEVLRSWEGLQYVKHHQVNRQHGRKGTLDSTPGYTRLSIGRALNCREILAYSPSAWRIDCKW